MSRHAQFEIVEEDANTLTIRDISGPTQLSVTNDAEAVVKNLHDTGSLKGRRLLYFDSYGDLDELKHDGKGTFLDFGPGPR